MERSSWHVNALCTALFGCMLLCAPGGVYASSYLGGDADAYLRAPVGAAAAAMGGAATARPPEPSGWWNPAAIDVRGGPVFSAGSGLRSLWRPEGYTAVYFKIPPRMSAGVCMMYRGDPRIELRDSDETIRGHAAFTSLTTKMSLGYAWSRHLSFGINIAMLYQSLPSDIDAHSTIFTVGGLDLGMHYRLREHLHVGLVLRHCNTVFNWQMKTGTGAGLQHARDVTMPPVMGTGLCWETSLWQRALQWRMDCDLHAFDKGFSVRQRPVLVLDNGVSWAALKQWHIRLGVGDVALDSDIYRDPDTYIDHFAVRASAGFWYIPPDDAMTPHIGYSLSNSKSLSGINQQIAIQYSF